MGAALGHRHVRISATLTWNNTRPGERAVRPQRIGSPQLRWKLAPRRATPQPEEGGSPQAPDAEGAPSDAPMELVLLPWIAAMIILPVAQFIEFVRREHATELASSIRVIVFNGAAVLAIHLAAIRYIFLPIGTV